MTHRKHSKDKISELRRLAESSFAQRAGDAVDTSTLSHEDVQKLVHELQVHQIELEIQNEELRQAQIKVEELKDRYLDRHDLAPVGYLTLDRNGVILEANLTSANLFGVERGLLIGKLLASFVNEEDGDVLHLHFRQVRETQAKQTCDIRLTRKDRSQIPVRLHSLTVKGHDGSPTVLRTAVIDVTSRKHAEEALHTSELRYRRLFQSAQDGILILDFDTGKILDANPFLMDLLGIAHEEILGRFLWEISPFEDTALNEEAFAKLQREGYVRYEDLPLETRDGRSIDVEFVSNSYPVDGKTFIQCNIRDITERKHAEEQLRLTTRMTNLTLDILKQLNKRMPTVESVQIIAERVQEFFQLEAVAIRLRDGEDYPYFINDGFAKDFIEAERYLCSRDADGEIIRDEQANPYLDCMCGNVIKGRTDSSLPFFTERGSFWSNCTTELLASTTEEDRQARTRNRCNGEGYESVALIPLRSENEIIGLFQLNDKRPNRFTLDMIHFLEELGESIGIALERCQMRQAMQAGVETVRLEREQLLSIFEGINEVILVIDPRTHEIVFANNFAEALYGKRLIGGTCYEKLNGLDNPCEYCANETVLELQGKTYQWEYRNPVSKRDFVANDRMIRWPDGRYLRFQLAIDVTDRKRWEREIEFKNLLLSTQQECSLDGILIVDENGGIQSFNSRFANIWGVPLEMMETKSDELVLQSIRDKPMHPQEFMEKVNYLYRHREETSHDEIALKDGRIIERYSSPMLASDMKYFGRVWYFRDITEQKKLQEQLIRAQKMEAVGTLAGGVAHDFNNVLQVALGYSELMLEDQELQQRYKADLQKINQAARRGADLVQRLLTFSRKTEIKPQPLQLNRRITELQKMLARTIPKMIDIQLLLDGDLVTINADPTQIDQVLMNLAVNARDAMPEGGKLIVETANITLDEEYARTHPEAKPGHHVLLMVTDTGMGMDKATLEHIFEPFYTTKGVGEGTGLGLAMVHGIVYQHGGHVRCYSELGQGTTFKVYFPALASEEEQEETTSRKMPRGGSETILLVDDEEMIRDLGSRILSKNGYNVITASNGKEALDVYERRGAEIAMVVLDLIISPRWEANSALKVS